MAVRHDTRTGELLLTCADSGVETPAGDRGDLFGRLGTFFHPATDADGELPPMPGTSLGMSVVRGIVDAHGGAIAVTSREGMGTIVTVRLPGASLEPAGRPAQREPAVPA